ncbi:MAG: RNB domain-containing ribonuclease [Nostocoides sp.]
MPLRAVRIPAGPGQGGAPRHADALAARFDAVRTDLEVPQEFPHEALAEAERVADSPLALPVRDATDIPFLTLDPVGSMDLDQALHLSRVEDGYRVRYAIAHLPSFVAPDGAIARAAWDRGATVYAPDRRTPLHPTRLSEGAASLLPGVPRAAYVWEHRLDGEGQVVSTDLYPAMIISRDRMDYAEVQQDIDAGTGDERLQLLREIGQLRIVAEAERGGASLPMPEQEAYAGKDGAYRLRFRPPAACEEWNAQLSLMTGMAAAQLMIAAGTGILRTMPPASPEALARFQLECRALGVGWPEEERYGDFLRRLDRTDPAQLALIHNATSLFRGAGYVAFSSGAPADRDHAAVAAPYAHVTAPLRRLVDRFGLAVCAAVAAGEDVPDWAGQALEALPAVMAGADRRSGTVERECTNAVEAAVLADRIGAQFPVVVVERTKRGATVQVTDPAVLAKAEGPGEVGTDAIGTVTAADIATSTTLFQLSPAVSSPTG